MIIADAVRASVQADVSWQVLDNRWYQDGLGLQGGEDAGVVVSAETIYLCTVVLAAVRFLADAYSMSPPSVILKDGARRTPVPDHPVQRLMRNPNLWQTGNRWRHVNMTWASTYGNAYNLMLPGPDYFVGELRPIHPTRCRVVDQRNDGSLVYRVSPLGKPEEIYGQERIHHVHGISFDGMTGAPIYRLIRNAVAIALAAEKHTATFLKKGQRLAGLLVPSGALEDEQKKELKESWNDQYGSVNATGTVGVLPFGVDFKPLAMDNVKAQLQELRDWQVGDILRGIGVPGVVVNYADKTSTYASAKEFFESGGIKHCILPWLINFEAEEEKDFLVEGAGDFTIKHNLDVLLRANTKDRYESLFKATGRPWMTGNEARAIEDLNPDPDPSMNEVALPVNLSAGTEDPPAPPPRPKQPPKPPSPADEEAEARMARAEQLAIDAAARVVRRELAAIRGVKGSLGAAAKYSRDPEGWRAWVADYYEKHVAFLVEALRIPEAQARAYSERQRQELLEGGVAAAETWETKVVPELAALVLEGR